MYEVNLRALSASGDFQGVIGRMDEIKALGINVIWLMPIHPIGEINSVNSPYSVKNYKQVNPEFGTLSDFKALVEKAHDLEMAVIIDWVANHDESAWDATPMVIFQGQQGALAASVIAIYLGGVPLIYGSQEVGVVENVPFFSNAPINWSLHPEMLQAYKSILNFYNGSDALRMGELTSYPNTDVLAFKRVYEQKEVLVLVNVRNNAVTYDIPEALKNTAWLDAFSNSAVTLPEVIDLGPYDYLVFSK